ncbi:TPA: AlpA family phage regulatory protein [Escherichia coli]|nr:AlpA family phage regulatory protein [Escherichia coli]
MNRQFVPPTPEQRLNILREYGFDTERRIREAQCKEMTTLSRPRRWEMEKEGTFPARQYVGRNTCTWLLSDVLWWIRNPPTGIEPRNPKADHLAKLERERLEKEEMLKKRRREARAQSVLLAQEKE